MKKQTKVILIVSLLLLIGAGVYAMRRKKPVEEPVKKKKAKIIIPSQIKYGQEAFFGYPTGNQFFVRVGAKMWSEPQTEAFPNSKLLKTYTAEDSVVGLALTGSKNQDECEKEQEAAPGICGDIWIQVDDFDTENNIGWIKEADLLQLQ